MTLAMVKTNLAPTEWGPEWDSKPWFQRDEVWGLDRKQKLIDSIKRGMPFGLICIWSNRVNGSTENLIIDGKQRCTTICAFMNGDFKDSEAKEWDEWTPEEQSGFLNAQVAVQVITLKDDEKEEMIFELFRRINTQSKQLSAGQLLHSLRTPIQQFMDEVFFHEIDEGGVYAENIKTLREKWAIYLCKTTFAIKRSTAHSELTFLAGLVVPLLTGKNEAITTSFDIISDNGLRDEVTDTMKENFFKKMNGDNGFMSIIQDGWDHNQFKKSAKGYPGFGQITPIIYLVNLFHDQGMRSGVEDVISGMRQFFLLLDEDDEKELEWKNRFRKNRNIESLKQDIQFIRQALNDAAGD